MLEFIALKGRDICTVYDTSDGSIETAIISDDAFDQLELHWLITSESYDEAFRYDFLNRDIHIKYIKYNCNEFSTPTDEYSWGICMGNAFNISIDADSNKYFKLSYNGEAIYDGKTETLFQLGCVPIITRYEDCWCVILRGTEYPEEFFGVRLYLDIDTFNLRYVTSDFDNIVADKYRGIAAKSRLLGL